MKKIINKMSVLTALAVGLTVISLFSILGSNSSKGKEVSKKVVIQKEKKVEKIESSEAVEEEKIPEAINGLVIGFDHSGGLTDVMMVGHIDPVSNQIKVISIPRDLEIYFTDPAFKAIKTNNPKNRILHCKLNNIYSLIGWDEAALQDVKSIIEVITGLEIDYMMTIDISGFDKMVDAVGGVDFYVPQNMHYSDPVQDLYINLKEGQQILDGDKAEQLIRYRKGYRMGDLQRIKVQQDFMVALVDQVAKTRDFGRIKELVTTGYHLLETDFGLVTMLDYAEFFYKLDLDHILREENMMTIPSRGEKVEGRWFQYFDLGKANEAVKELLEKNMEKIKTADEIEKKKAE